MLTRRDLTTSSSLQPSEKLENKYQTRMTQLMSKREQVSTFPILDLHCVYEINQNFLFCCAVVARIIEMMWIMIVYDIVLIIL